jgi:hypothetical protein
VRLGIGGMSSSSQETPEEFSTASGYAGGPTIFFQRRLRERKSRGLSPTENLPLASPSTRFLAHLQESRAQASDPEETTLATFCVAMSSYPEPQVKSETLTYVQRPRLVGPSVRVLGKPSPKARPSRLC